MIACDDLDRGGRAFECGNVRDITRTCDAQVRDAFTDVDIMQFDHPDPRWQCGVRQHEPLVGRIWHQPQQGAQQQKGGTRNPGLWRTGNRLLCGATDPVTWKATEEFGQATTFVILTHIDQSAQQRASLRLIAIV